MVAGSSGKAESQPALSLINAVGIPFTVETPKGRKIVQVDDEEAIFPKPEDIDLENMFKERKSEERQLRRSRDTEKVFEPSPSNRDIYVQIPSGRKPMNDYPEENEKIHVQIPSGRKPTND